MALPLLVSTRFQVLLTPLAGVLFTFPSRYWFTIGRRRVFSLTTWSSWIPAGFHVSRGTQVPAASRTAFTYGAVTLSGRSYNPDGSEDPSVWAVSRSLAATDEITKLFSLPSGTKMVHFPEFASGNLWIQFPDTARSAQWVPPFGDLRINACLRLPEAYRS